jgi:hypothetical protein
VVVVDMRVVGASWALSMKMSSQKLPDVHVVGALPVRAVHPGPPPQKQEHIMHTIDTTDHTTELTLKERVARAIAVGGLSLAVVGLGAGMGAGIANAAPQPQIKCPATGVAGYGGYTVTLEGFPPTTYGGIGLESDNGSVVGNSTGNGPVFVTWPGTLGTHTITAREVTAVKPAGDNPVPTAWATAKCSVNIVSAASSGPSGPPPPGGPKKPPRMG